MADLGLAQAGASFAGAKLGAALGTFIPVPGLGTLFGAALGTVAGKLVGKRPSRYSTISGARIEGNAFAQGCIRSGVGSAACPVGQLEQWASLSRTRYPAAYASVFAPLLARRPVAMGYVQGLARRYLSKRTQAPGFAQAAARLGVAAQASGGSYRPSFALRV